MTRAGTVITFYSYKGGVGRTMAMANIGALLSIWGYRVLCIDWDLEAPGLPMYFRNWSGEVLTPGIVDYFSAVADGKTPDWHAFTFELTLPGAARPTTFIRAGIPDSSYLDRMQTLDWQQLYASRQLGSLIEDLRREWKSDFDFTLVDSRTGITDIGGICSIQIPDVLVAMFTANEQSVAGTLDTIERVQKSRSTLPFDRTSLQILPILTRLESRVEYGRSQQWIERASTAFEPTFRSWVQRNVLPEQMFTFLRIPSIPYWSFGEELAVVEKGTRDPEDLGYAYDNVAALIANGLAGTEVLVENRDAFLASARSAPAKLAGIESPNANESNALNVFISYSHADSRYVHEFEAHLSPLIRSGLIRLSYAHDIARNLKWSREIDLQLEKAQVIVLMLSPDYFASDYAFDVEMKRALERHYMGAATVIPVILRPCDWALPALASLRVLPDGGSPVSQWSNRDAAFLNIVQGLRTAIDSTTSLPFGKRVISSVAVKVPLSATGANVWAGTLPSELDLNSVRVFLTVKVDSPSMTETIQRLPMLLKVSSGIHLQQLIRQALPGLALRYLPSPPASVPAEAGTLFFELVTQSAVWAVITKTRSVALYSPAEFVNPDYNIVLLTS